MPRSPPASTSISRSRSRSISPRRAPLLEAAAGARPADRLRARHLPRRRPPERAPAARRGRDRRGGRRHRLLHGGGPRALASRTPTSTTPARAAGRCSTWAPTTSPTSSTCSGRSPRSRPSAGSAATRGVIRTGPRAGSEVPVECTTHIAGVMAFESGAIVQIATSFEVWAHKHTPIELYGTEGSLARARSQPLRRHARAASGGRRVAGGAVEPWLCGWQLPQPRPCRHGRARSARSGRTARAASSPATCSR